MISNSDLPQNFWLPVLQSASVLQAPGSALRMLSATDFHTLTDASERYLMQEDYGVPKVKNEMLQFEQQCVQRGGVDDGDKLVKELTGKSSFEF
jgi:hypothetical protein